MRIWHVQVLEMVARGQQCNVYYFDAILVQAYIVTIVITYFSSFFFFYAHWFWPTSGYSRSWNIWKFYFYFKGVCRFFQMHFPMRICTFEFFSFYRSFLFLWVPLEPIWTKLIFGFLWSSNHPNGQGCLFPCRDAKILCRKY